MNDTYLSLKTIFLNKMHELVLQLQDAECHINSDYWVYINMTQHIIYFINVAKLTNICTLMLQSYSLRPFLELKRVPSDCCRLMNLFWSMPTFFCRYCFQLNFCLTIPRLKFQFSQNSIFQSNNEAFY